MRFGCWREVTLALTAAAAVSLLLPEKAAADGWISHTLPRSVPAINYNTGQPFMAPPVPYGEYAKDYAGTIHGALGILPGALGGLLHGGGGLCSNCGGAGCGLCRGGLFGHRPCGYCGGAGCGHCLGGGLGGLGLAKGLLYSAIHPHAGRVKYFVGAGGPVPLTPGYVPYVVPTRSPRDFFAFPPFSPLDP